METALAGLSDARLFAAVAVVLAYAAMSAWFLRRPQRRSLAAVDVAADGDPILVAYASQTGFAEEIAMRTAKSLQSTGAAVLLAPLAELDAAKLREVKQALFIVSTTGEGDAPDCVAAFVRRTLDRSDSLVDLRYGVLALGDREYTNFCAFGHRLDQWLRRQNAGALFDVVEVDNGDEGALRLWLHQLSVLTAAPDLPDWESPRYERWGLVSRRLLNPESAGDPCFHIALQPCDADALRWRAGDIAEIDPRNSTWRDSPRPAGPLPHREYSIASLPADGAVELLVRQMHRPEGEPGLGSGWLTQQAQIGDAIALRIRPNSNFHAPADDRPLILIGNGTGLAGLRALLKERIAAGQRRNWLIFGERNARCDAFCRDELERWTEERSIERLDLVFSRDQSERRYVQHRLLECAAEVQSWVDDGAAIYVCGSMQGMAPGVDAALTQVLGAAAIEDLASRGGYRRDVY